MMAVSKIILAGVLWGCTVISPVYAQETTWISPPVSTQLEMDETLVPIGKGAVFCPAMTDPDNEPNYGILEDGRIVNDAKMGNRIPLSPGIYTVVYGTGTIDQMMRKEVRVVEGSVTVIKPEWSGLVIEVINESRANIREYYELFELDTGVSYGLGLGVEEGLDERLMTWILPPGNYKIVKPGDNINAVINFGTIRLMPGELVHTDLVIDSNTENFLGFGRIANVQQVLQQRDKKWKVRSELAGNALLNYVPSSESGAGNDTNFTTTAQWLSDGRFESGRHIIPIWYNLEEGLSMESDRVLRKYIDKAELRLTYIYRLSDYLSPYVRFSAETRLFKTIQRFENTTDYAMVSTAGDTLNVINGAEEVSLGKTFSPILLKQGFGMTSALVKSVPVNLNVRSGYGARQTYARKSFIFNSDENTLSPVVESKITGIEFLLLGDIRLGRFILLNTDFDVLLPEKKKETWVYDGESRLRLNLTSNVSLLFKFEFWKDESVKNVQTRYQTLLRFSKYL